MMTTVPEMMTLEQYEVAKADFYSDFDAQLRREGRKFKRTANRYQIGDGHVVVDVSSVRSSHASRFSQGRRYSGMTVSIGWRHPRRFRTRKAGWDFAEMVAEAIQSAEQYAAEKTGTLKRQQANMKVETAPAFQKTTRLALRLNAKGYFPDVRVKDGAVVLTVPELTPEVALAVLRLVAVARLHAEHARQKA